MEPPPWFYPIVILSLCDIIYTDGALAQLARAPALQAGRQEFESLMLHH